MNAVVEKIEPQTRAVAAATPMSLLESAVAAGNIELAEKLMTLQERWEANHARKAFDEAVANAKAEIKPIVRNSTGHNDKKYADMAAVASAVDPILSKHGLSYRYRAAQAERISVTCILSHKAGHYEETPLSAGPDKTGNKNDIQAIGSSLTYLQRYSLMLALGLAAAKDDDGKAAGKVDDTPPAPGSISEQQADNIRELLEAKGISLAAFLGWAKQKRVCDIPADQYDSCIDGINKFKKAGK